MAVEVFQRVTHRSSQWSVIMGKTMSLIFPILLALVMLTFTRIAVVDDAFISYRYALNLTRGYGLVFNPSEHVEGMTNLLWTLLMAVPIELGFPPQNAGAILGLAFGVFAAVDARRLCNRLGINQWAAVAAMVVLGLDVEYWLTVTNGLEGGLFAFLLMRTLYSVISAAPPTVAGIWGGLLFMTRPETVVLLPVCSLYPFIAPENRNIPLRRVIRHSIVPLVALWLAIVVGVTLWRLSYYGSLIPNSIIAKSVPGLDLGMLRKNMSPGLHYFLEFLASSVPLTLGSVLAVILAPRRPAIWLCLAIIVVELPMVLINGGDWMPHHRLFSVYAPLMAVLLGISLDRVISLSLGLRLSYRWAMQWVTVLLLMAGVILTLRNNSQEQQLAGGWTTQPRLEVREGAVCYKDLAIALKPVLLPADKVSSLVLGVFSYALADFYSHDMLGITDAYLAQHGNYYWSRIGKSDFAYSYQQVYPTVVVLHRYGLPDSAMPQVSGGPVKDEYVVFARDEEPYCHELTILRRDSVARILPALTKLHYVPFH